MLADGVTGALAVAGFAVCGAPGWPPTLAARGVAMFAAPRTPLFPVAGLICGSGGIAFDNCTGDCVAAFVELATAWSVLATPEALGAEVPGAVGTCCTGTCCASKDELTGASARSAIIRTAAQRIFMRLLRRAESCSTLSGSLL